MNVIIISGKGTYFLDKNEFLKDVIFSKKSNVIGYYKGVAND